MAANPIGMAALAAAALTVAIIGVVNATERGTDAEKKAREAREANIKAINESANAIKQRKESQQDAINSTMADISLTETYVDQLRGLVDENGRVKKGNEDRANTLYELINSAIPGVISANKDEAGSYYGISDSIDEVLEKKKAKMLLDAMEPSYVQALKDRQKYLDELTQAEINLQKATEDSIMYNQRTGVEWEKSTEKYNEALKTAKQNLIENESTISRYTDLSTKYVSGSMEELESAVANISTNIKKAKDASVQELSEQAQQFQRSYELIVEAVKNGESSATEAEIKALRDRAEQAKAEFRKAAEEQAATARNSGTEAGKDYADGYGSGIASAADKSKASAEHIVELCNAALKGDTSKYGTDYIQGFLTAILAGDPSPEVTGFVLKALEALATAQDSNSPSKKTMQLGKDFNAGYEQGIKENTGVVSAVGRLAQSALEKLQSILPGASKAGQDMPSSYSGGVSGGSGLVIGAVSSMAVNALSILKGKIGEFGKAGESAAQKNAEGIRNQSDSVSNATQAMTDKAKITAAAIAATMSTVGIQMGDGVIVGLNKVTQRVAQTAAAMSLAALVAAKAAVGIHSPSKDFEEQVGAQMVAGAVQGIVKNTKKATKKAEDLSRGILSAASKWVDDRKFFNSLALENEAEFWDQMSKVSNLSADDRLEAEKKAFTARENLAKQSYETSKKWIEQEKFYSRLSGEEEIEAWERVVARKNLLTKDQEDAERNLYATKQRLLKEQQDAYDSYLKSVESRANTLRDFTGLFGEVKKETEVSGYQLLQNLRGQVEAFEGWQEDIAKLTEKGISGPLLDELREMGPKAANEIHALTTLSKEQLDEYTGLFQKMGKMATEQAESEIKPVEVPLTLAGLDTKEISATVGKSVGSVCLSISGKTKDFIGETTKIITAMCDTVLGKYRDFYDVGSNAMNGLREGLQVSGRSAIATARSIADEIISTMQSALDIHSPSRKMRDLVGVPTAQGFFVGFENEMAGLSQKMQAAVNAETSKISITAATQAEGNMARSGVTREIHERTHTRDRIAQLEGDGVTGELIRMLNLKLKGDDRRTGLCLVN